MSKEFKDGSGIRKYYNAVAENYYQQYEIDNLYNISFDYPANYFRLQLLLKSFTSKNIKKVIEVGVGDGTPLTMMARSGMDVWGFDLSEKMVAKAQEAMRKIGLEPERIFWGDIQDPLTFTHVLKNGQFDGVIAMGVMPHIENDDLVLHNMISLLRPGGSIFVEFRNKLFSLFTFNRYTADFILNDLLKDVDNKVKECVARDLATRLRMDMPPIRERAAEDPEAPGYDAILAKFHNPFEAMELFKRHKFHDISFRWYHYHPAMPYLEGELPELFRKEAIRLEQESSGWRGYFLCSAFIIEAVKGRKSE
jgi:2-polyprenyl-3-methyl-5-hydroxy-6-metoxy-1,4-benzoquinol methylase